MVELIAEGRSFATGLLLELIEALRATRQGELVALLSDPSIEADLDAWSRFTGNAIVERTVVGQRVRWVIRHGAIGSSGDDNRPIGSRVWLYTNFDCNLACDYCCVRSSPRARRRELGLARVRRIALEAPPLGTESFFITGGEPLLLPDIAEIVDTCAAAAPTTLLTNGILLRGTRLDALRSLPRDRVTLQISLDSPTPELHDRHRGPGSWRRAWDGVQRARTAGFRVRLAATVERDDEEQSFREFLHREGIAPEDRVVRRVALRGFATRGVALSRVDLSPEIAITAEGVFWHPVGAEDADLLVTPEIFPLLGSFEAVRLAAQREQAFSTRLASVFHCA